MNTSDILALMMAIIAGISLIFAILGFTRSKTKDSNAIQVRLVKIETDVLYIRESMEKREDWEKGIEKRVNALERNKK